jgi:hypothetical protein
MPQSSDSCSVGKGLIYQCGLSSLTGLASASLQVFLPHLGQPMPEAGHEIDTMVTGGNNKRRFVWMKGLRSRPGQRHLSRQPIRSLTERQAPCE